MVELPREEDDEKDQTIFSQEIQIKILHTTIQQLKVQFDEELDEFKS